MNPRKLITLLALVAASASLSIVSPSEAMKRSGSFTFGVIGDAGLWNDATREVTTSLLKADVKQMILAGDNLYEEAASYSDAWSPWFSYGFSFPLVALGNHYKSYKSEMAYFGMPAEYYSKVVGKARFIVLNSDNKKNVTAQAHFLADELEAAKERYVFLVFHHPPFTLSNNHGWKEREAFAKVIRATLKAHPEKVTAILVGHDHHATIADADGIPIILSGAVFEQFSGKKVDYLDGGFAVKTRWLYDDTPHWARLDFDSEEAWITFIRAKDDKMTCTARLHPRPLLLKSNCN